MLLNLDGLVGPSHHFGGLAFGNLASMGHGGQRSNPRQAALQGLDKMWQLQCLGFTQGILPPALRPDISLLRAAGFSGDDNAVTYQASRTAPHLLSAAFSASSMWAANAATVTAASDSLDGRLQFTPANLISTLHRSIEARHNSKALRSIFSDSAYFQHHCPLPAQSSFADEGAANHIRLYDPQGVGAINLFVYGRDEAQQLQGNRFPARQSRLASESIIRRHRIPADQQLLIQQSPVAISAGAFHNDVVAVGHANLLLIHEHAFANQIEVLQKLRGMTDAWNSPLQIIEISNNELPLELAIKSYLFNSQLLLSADQEWVLVAPQECRLQKASEKIIETRLCEIINRVLYFDLKESMHNGGGPACLRLAIPLDAAEYQAAHPGILLTAERYQQLQSWIVRHYRDQLTLECLSDPQLRREILTAMDALTRIFSLPNLYSLDQAKPIT